MRTAPITVLSEDGALSPAKETLASGIMTPYVAASRPVRAVRVLLATTGRLPSTARMAMELHHAGAQVSLVSPACHPARVLDFLTEQLSYRAVAPTWSLEAALKRLRPDVVIPCDERAVRDLHVICRRTRDAELRKLIEASTAPMRNFATITSRAALLALAEREGVRVPPAAGLEDRVGLTTWMQKHAAPFVLKADGSWSGFGVRIISDATQAAEAYGMLTRPIGLRLALREAVLEGNYFGFRPWARREQPAMSVQGFIDGWPANIGVACWKGEVLASICAEAVATESATGPSTVARVIDNPEMVDAATRVVKALGLSGMVGFDFMIEAATGSAYMIEMNPRNTPVCALRLGEGRDLPEALLACVGGRAPRERPPRTERDIIVFFPETWSSNPSNSFLHSGYHDVPWEQPELVRTLVRAERRERYLVFRLLRRAWLSRQGKRQGGD